MGLFENLPFTNFDNLNLDMIVKDISVMKGNEEFLKDKVEDIEEQIGDFNIEELEGRIDALEESDGNQNTEINSIKGRVTNLEASDTAQNTEISSIKSRLTTAEGRITTNSNNISTNDQASRGRDDALSARIRNLEQATIHDIYNTYSDQNLLLFGSYMQDIPAECRTGNGTAPQTTYPFEYGNTLNHRFSTGTETVRAWIFDGTGFKPNPLNLNVYDYYQVGRFDPYFGSKKWTLTFFYGWSASSGRWAKFTFNDANSVWDFANGCRIKVADFNTALYPLNDKSIWFMGKGSDWNTALGGAPIKYMFVEFGDGSVDTRDTPKFNIKDREFFGHDATPTLAEAVITGQVTEDTTVTYYDLVGEPQTITSEIIMTVNLKKYGKVVDGYINVRMNLTANVGDVLARGAQFTLTGLAMTYNEGVNAPMPDLTSPLRGSANDSKYYEWAYNNTQNTYLFVNIANDGTWNLKLLSGGMRNYTGASDTYTEFRIPIHYIAN